MSLVSHLDLMAAHLLRGQARGRRHRSVRARMRLYHARVVKLVADSSTFGAFLASLLLGSIRHVAVSTSRDASVAPVGHGQFICEPLFHVQTLAVQNCDLAWLGTVLLDESSPLPDLYILELVAYSFPSVCEPCGDCVHTLVSIKVSTRITSLRGLRIFNITPSMVQKLE
ncbi:uncharacterized protein PHACADRAFT_255127 [Phanerochaete carnosa HHB-10118-sp]|uniref:Uncharacterized protein n=1 Tax=Phanerochaete carnosa (strain HHB-10118-sp) TaxID=650164 RepID=K5WEB6_PHACS|nr:uncharacterized protein PHACADRAFT_255127 [Phanerochaete carnosa HHB-10118-sp]EKM57399.1 hypothetical protein PHACADRAFT_255127 [Phanerochaete carnosa HHB-10118-sp]